MSSLLEDIEAAELPDCSLCEFIQGQAEPTKSALTRAAAGSIGPYALEDILRKHEAGIGRGTIRRHRSEAHTP